MGFFKPADYRKWAHHEDVVSLDTYPDPSDSFAAAQNAAQCDLTRALGDGKPWMLMEQTSSAVNWRPRNVLKQPGQMRLWSMQAVARGANTVMFFQWRAAKAGAEKFHGALVPHIGVENSRVWREVSALGNELQELGPLAQSRVVADVGILVDWQSWWALEQDSKPSTAVTFHDRLAAFYGPLFAANLTTDFVFTDSDFAAYKLLVIPNLYLVDDATAAKIEAYVAAGGTAVIGFFSGIVDENEHIRLGGYPAPFRKLLGLRVEEFAPMAEGESNAVCFADGTTAACDLWADVIDLEGAGALATFVGNFYAGQPAITEHSFGQGRAFYIGTRLAAEPMAALLGRICHAAGVTPLVSAPPGVEVVRRRTVDGRDLWFVLNHRPEVTTVTLPVAGIDVLRGTPTSGVVALAPFDVAIVQME
jgi:beta-galactosidase